MSSDMSINITSPYNLYEFPNEHWGLKIDPDNKLTTAINTKNTAFANPIDWSIGNDTQFFFQPIGGTSGIQMNRHEDYILFHDRDEAYFAIDFRMAIKISYDVGSGEVKPQIEIPLLKLNFDFSSPEYDIYIPKKIIINDEGNEEEVDDLKAYNNRIGLIINNTNMSRFLPYYKEANFSIFGSDYLELGWLQSNAVYGFDPANPYYDENFDYSNEPTTAQLYAQHPEVYDDVFNFISNDSAVVNGLAGSN